MDCKLQHIPGDIDSNTLVYTLLSKGGSVRSLTAAPMGHPGFRSQKGD